MFLPTPTMAKKARVGPLRPTSAASNTPPTHVDLALYGIPDLQEGETIRADNARVLLFHSTVLPSSDKILKKKFGEDNVDSVKDRETEKWWFEGIVPEKVRAKDGKLAEIYSLIVVGDELRPTTSRAMSCIRKYWNGDWHTTRVLFTPHYEQHTLFTVGRNLNIFQPQDGNTAMLRGSMRRIDYMYITNAEEEEEKESIGIVAFGAIEIGPAALLKRHKPLSSICPSKEHKKYKDVRCAMQIPDYDYDDHTFHTLINGPTQEAIFTGEEREYSMITIQKTKRTATAEVPLALNCKVDDGKLDVVVLLKQTASKIAKHMIRANEFEDSDDFANRWYGGQSKVLYVKPGEIVLTLAEEQEIGIDGKLYKCGPEGLLSQKIRIKCFTGEEGFLTYSLPNDA
ncbi:hypothetical protein TrST_g3563 [Triparma strigata]|uniref:Uncharacterized protein n=1 Tax=Triparma strigata TaxID=1606541 RepID=A0A9W7EEM2_9STRA|nr:hypothetical protein TrST_g3563 [Triparma strigata]